MAEIVFPSKALAVNPLKASQPIGASLAFLGLADAMPLEHGARGCAAFNKLFFMRHFREPIALQTTAMDQMMTVLGADGNVVEALSTICAKNPPAVIGLITTGLSESQGADIPPTIAAFRAAYPQYNNVSIIPVSATDTLGNLETGFALAVEAIIAALAPSSPSPPRLPRKVNVLTSAMLTPGDVEAIKDWIGAFGLAPIVLPDIDDSLGGHLIDAGFSTLTYGGTPLDMIADMGRSIATLVIGHSLNRAADLLRARTNIPDYRFASIMGLEECDAFTAALAEISGREVPAVIERKRAQLQDAMVDCQFQLGGARAAVAADPDLLAAIAGFLTSLGVEVVAAVASVRADHLSQLPIESAVIGDLEDFEWLAREQGAELIITNSHGAEIAGRLGTAFLRAGFPIYDSYGAHARTWIGYAGSRQLLFDIANLLAGHYQEIAPYRSRYWQGTPRDLETVRDISC
jgi:nitrogenase molybdenum-iron cofactor biosynthesis protein NifN